jgi:hypothetical protein
MEISSLNTLILKEFELNNGPLVLLSKSAHSGAASPIYAPKMGF